MCQLQNTRFCSIKSRVLWKFPLVAQAFAHLAQAPLRKFLMVCAALYLGGCGSTYFARSAKTQVVDQILPSGDQVFLFDFNQSRFQKVSQSSLHALQTDSIFSSLGIQNKWLAIPTPGEPFLPIKAVWGRNGNFFLLDLSQKRLCQYDTAGQIISTFSLPPEIQKQNLDRMEIFWTRDGMFSFLDLHLGIAWQYSERRLTSGGSDWQLRNTLHLPINLESCLWEPFLKNPCCHKKQLQAENNFSTQCFDGYFNSLGSFNASMVRENFSIAPSSQSEDWDIRFINHAFTDLESSSPKDSNYQKHP